MIFNLPNNLTLLRIALIPFIAGLMFVGEFWAAWTAWGLYTIACVTDWLDGYLARKMKIVSAFGRFLDPIADKLLITILLLVFAGLGKIDGLWPIPACVIMFREVLISGLREFLGPQNIIIHVSKLAKYKTFTQMIALGFLLVGDFGNWLVPDTLLIGKCLLSVSAVFTFITGWNYMAQGIKAIVEMENK